MSLPTTGSYEWLEGTLAYLFQTEIASPFNIQVHWPECGFIATEATVWAHVRLEPVSRKQLCRSNPVHEKRLGVRTYAHLDITLYVRELPDADGSVYFRRAAALGDAVRGTWPPGRTLPLYRTGGETIDTTPWGLIHITDVEAKAAEPKHADLFSHIVRFELQYLAESEV